MLRIDIDKVTFEDADLFQAATGVSFTKAVVEWHNGDLSAAAGYGLMWLAKRQAGQDVAFDEVKALPWVEAMQFELADDEPDPTDAAS